MLRRKVSMARGKVVVDENLLVLVPYIRAQNIKVDAPLPGMSDTYIAANIASDEIFVTNNPDHFRRGAIAHTIGVIGLPQSLLADPETAAIIISDTIIKFGLWRKLKPYIIKLDSTGKRARFTSLRGL